MKSLLRWVAIKLTTSLSVNFCAVLILSGFVSVQIYRSPAIAAAEPTTDPVASEFADRQIQHSRKF
jgi:hypothetical protein